MQQDEIAKLNPQPSAAIHWLSAPVEI